jgi:hypothetical protein
MERVMDPADPHRCKASVGTGQCMTVAEEGSDYCRVHAGSYQPPEKGLRQYLLARAQDRARLAAFAEHDDIKSLRDEIALTRMMVEGLWNSAQSDVERLAIYGRVNSHILTLEKLVKTCNQIEERLGSLLAKPTLLRVGQQICQKLVARLEGLPNYEQLVDTLIRDVITTIQEARNDAPIVPALSAPADS